MAFEQYNKLGHPGKFATSTTVTSGELVLTGSNYGHGAVIRGTGATGNLHLSNGGTIALGDLDAGVVHELSLEKVSSVSGGNVYLLKRGF
jgi:hypothetical protein